MYAHRLASHAYACYWGLDLDEAPPGFTCKLELNEVEDWFFDIL